MYKLSWAVVVLAFNASIREAEAGRSLRVRGQPCLQEIVPGQVPKLQRNLSQKTQKEKKLSLSARQTYNLLQKYSLQTFNKISNGENLI